VTHEALLQSIRSLVERVAGPSRSPLHAGPDTRLAEGYWLDSVELLELVISCESRFGITFDEARDFENGNLSTLGTLTHLVQSKLSARCES
jgi:acyl carrier protein